MMSYPLVFSFRNPIVGNSFVAGVAIDGRVILTEEDDGDTWMFGVQPGGVAGGDKSQAGAYKAFKDSYLSVLFDMAAEAQSFVDFKKSVEDFFAQTNAPNAQDWSELHHLVQRGSISLPNFPKVTQPAAPKLEIVLLDAKKSKPTVNEFDAISAAA